MLKIKVVFWLDIKLCLKSCSYNYKRVESPFCLECVCGDICMVCYSTHFFFNLLNSYMYTWNFVCLSRCLTKFYGPLIFNLKLIIFEHSDPCHSLGITVILKIKNKEELRYIHNYHTWSHKCMSWLSW